MNERTVGIISIFAGALPAIAGLLIFYKAGFKHRLLVLFLIYGFLTDLFKWQFYEHEFHSAGRSLFYIYSLIGSAFFCWFIHKSCDYITVSKIALILSFAFPLFWLFTHFDFTGLTWQRDMSEGLFNTVYGMVISVLASFSILRLTQKKELLLSIPDFWFLGGIFFYFFCTFFVKAFLQTPQMDRFWFIHDLFNIITSFIFTCGFFKIETQNPS